MLFRQALDREHVGRGREKDQALDYLVARQTAAETHAAAGDGVSATLLCLAGPSGVGRTAFARALASALTRRFVRVSLAGAADPAALPGVARPASDAGAGRLVDALRRLGPLPGRAGDNPLVLLGELDQLGRGRGRSAAPGPRPRQQPRVPGPLRGLAAGPRGACCWSPPRATRGASRRCCASGSKCCRWPDTPTPRSS